MAHPDLDNLCNLLLDFAQEMLGDYGEFLPFAGSLSTESEYTHAATLLEDEDVSAEDTVDVLLNGLREQARAGEVKATGICIDVRTVPPGDTEKTDAILVMLEHIEGEAVDVFLPYKKHLDEIEFGTLYADDGERIVFD